MNMQHLHDFHQTKLGYIVFGLIELGLAVLFGSLAIDSGHLWEWALTALFLLGAAQNGIKLLELFTRGLKK